LGLPALLLRVLVQKTHDVRFAGVDLEAIYLHFRLLRCKPPLDFDPSGLLRFFTKRWRANARIGRASENSPWYSDAA
jgi:hypothetical protein